MKIKTELLKSLVSKAMHGVGNNKLIPITNLMNLKVENDKFVITTTDATNYLYVSDVCDEDPFYVTVYAEMFAKLVSKLTCEYVSLTVTNNSLEVKGNGTYNLELPLDEEGEFIKYPNPFKFEEVIETGEISLSTIQTILNAVKPSLATTAEIPCYMGYYMGDEVIATDTFKIASMATKMFNIPVLMSADTLNLVSLMVDEKIKYTIWNNNEVSFHSHDCDVHGVLMNGINDYAVTEIKNLVDKKFTSMCKLSKDTLLQLLDRLSLFVGAYDKNEINLTFTSSGLCVKSKNSSGVEIIEYLDSENLDDFVCTIDIQMLQSQVKTHSTSSVELWYGLDNAIKLVDGNITQIIALSEDE